MPKDEFSSFEIMNLYKRRWEIETHFRVQKQTVELENFVSRTTNKIKQEYFSKILLLNLTNLLIQETIEENPKVFENGKYKINKNLAYGLVKDKIDSMLMGINSEEIANTLKKKF